MERVSVWATSCHPIYWALQIVDEEISGCVVSLSFGALRGEPREGLSLLGTPKGYV
jgi:hypothetical protein